jgi:hypothetical protein
VYAGRFIFFLGRHGKIVVLGLNKRSWVKWGN